MKTWPPLFKWVTNIHLGGESGIISSPTFETVIDSPPSPSFTSVCNAVIHFVLCLALPESQVRRYRTQLPTTVPNSNIILTFKRSEDGLVCFSVAYWPSPCTSTCRLWQHQALLPTLPDRPAQRTHNQNWLGNMQNKCRRKLCQGNYNKTSFLQVLRLSHLQEISIQAKVHSEQMVAPLWNLLEHI